MPISILKTFSLQLCKKWLYGLLVFAIPLSFVELDNILGFSSVLHEPPLGIETRFTAYETVVLPLNYEGIFAGYLAPSISP